VNRKFSRQESKLIAIALLAAALLSAWYILARPLITMLSDMRSHRMELQQRLSVYKRLADRLPQLEKIQQDRKVQSSAVDDLWTAKTADLAGAKIQDWLVKTASLAEIEMATSQGLPPVKADGLQKIAVRVTFNSDITRLQHMLYAIETYRPALFIEVLSIHANGIGEENSDPILDVQADVVGYREALE